MSTSARRLTTGSAPPRKIYTRTIVEKAPSHNGMPCYAVWEKTEYQHELNTPPDDTSRLKWCIQIYDTSPAAGDPEYLRTVAERIHTTTWPNRDVWEHPNRIEIHGLPLPEGTFDKIRVERCIGHQKAEAMARHEARDADFLLQPLFNDYHWRGFITSTHKSFWGLPRVDFLEVEFERRTKPLRPWTEGWTEDEMEQIRELGFSICPHIHFTDGLLRFCEGISWFYESFVNEGRLTEDWSWDLCKLNCRGEYGQE
ncbi:Arca [Fusarium albosuccineum]|uniref:Arca n=1 Tax=Fusarium albosuccineum TaxID=1237068 RepID=A0A8H4LJ59_9HYPO|nr:Arca [Fusarium albosuccineum]